MTYRTHQAKRRPEVVTVASRKALAELVPQADALDPRSRALDGDCPRCPHPDSAHHFIGAWGCFYCERCIGRCDDAEARAGWGEPVGPITESPRCAKCGHKAWQHQFGRGCRECGCGGYVSPGILRVHR